MAADPGSGDQHPAVAEERPSRGRRAMLVAAGVLLVIAVVAIGSAFVPRWWAQRIGDQVDGSMSTGIVLGLFYGFLFTLLPLTLLRWTFSRRRSWKVVGWSLAGAIVLALPNLVTLAIVVGTGNAAHAGERTLDVRAPGFRYGTVAGAIAAVLVWLLVEYLLFSRRSSLRRADRLNEQLQEQLRAPPGGTAEPGLPPPP